MRWEGEREGVLGTEPRGEGDGRPLYETMGRGKGETGGGVDKAREGSGRRKGKGGGAMCGRLTHTHTRQSGHEPHKSDIVTLPSASLSPL